MFARPAMFTRRRHQNHHHSVITLLCLLFLTGAGVALADASPTPPSLSDLQKCGDSEYATMAGDWSSNGCFWCTGTALDTMLDYLEARGEGFCATGSGCENLDTYRELARRTYRSTTTKDRYGDSKTQPSLYFHLVSIQSCWYDDIGWWGVTSARLYEKLHEEAQGCSTTTGTAKEKSDCKELHELATLARRASQALWQYMSHGATDVWQQAENQGKGQQYANEAKTYANLEKAMNPPGGHIVIKDMPTPGSLAPVFTGGVWNTCYGPNEKDSGEPSGQTACKYTAGDLYTTAACNKNNPSIPGPGKGPLNAIQNSVTNGLWLILSSKLHALATGHGWTQQPDPDDTTLQKLIPLKTNQYLDAAKAHVTWFRNWSTYKGSGDRVTAADSPFLLTISSDKDGKTTEEGFLVKERVSQYKNGFPVYGYNPNRAWTGGQGLFVQGLMAYHAITKDAQAKQSALTIAETTRDHVVDDEGRILPAYQWYGDKVGCTKAPKGQVCPPPPGFTFDPWDYDTGPAVFLRAVQSLMQQGVVGKDDKLWKPYIQTNAASVCQGGKVVEAPQQLRTNSGLFYDINVQGLINLGLMQAK